MKLPWEQSIKGSQEVYILEVEKGTKLPELTGDLKESLKTLQYNPAFQYLLQRLSFKKAALQTTLNEGLDLTEVQLRYMQAGIFWTSWLASELRLLTQTVSTPRPASEIEREEFEKLKALLEPVGA